MFESAAGLLTPTTRQNAGNFVNVWRGDTASEPPSTTVAAVIVVLPSKVSRVKSLHWPVPAAARAACADKPAANESANMADTTPPVTSRCLMTDLPLVQYVVTAASRPRARGRRG